MFKLIVIATFMLNGLLVDTAQYEHKTQFDALAACEDFRRSEQSVTDEKGLLEVLQVWLAQNGYVDVEVTLSSYCEQSDDEKQGD